MSLGYHTQSILCIPVKNGEGKIVGVLQAINRHDGPFTAVDEEAMSLFAGQVRCLFFFFFSNILCVFTKLVFLLPLSNFLTFL